MLFKSVEMYNFGRYLGKTTLDTTVTRDRNVILIKASNDRGKTTLFKAIKYVLYGDRDVPASDWINFQAAAEGDGEMYAEIKFEDGNKEYRLRRSVKFRQTRKGEEISTVGRPKAELFDKNGPVEVDGGEGASKDRIDGMLPRDASKFFFFDGEEIQGYISNQNAHVKDAIEKILGIREMFNALEDMQRIKQGMDEEYSKLARKQTKSLKERDKLDAIERDLVDNEEKIKAHESAKKGALRRQEDFKKRLADHEVIKGVMEERNRAEQECIRIKNRLGEIEKSLGKQRGDLGIVMLAGLLHTISRDEGMGAIADDCESKIVRDMVEGNAKVCICGRVIDAEVRIALERKVRDDDLPTRIHLKRFVERMLIESHVGRREADLRQLSENQLSHIQELDAKKTVIERCSNEIKNVPFEEFAECGKRYEEATEDVGKFDRDIERLGREKVGLEKERGRIERKIEAGANDTEMQNSRRHRDMCDVIIQGLEESIEKFYQKRKPELEKHVSKIFSVLTNNPDLYKSIGIDREFNLVVARYDGTKLATDKYSPSAGASQVVATAMIGGMNRFSTKEAPIVIDTPLGRLDPIHRSNVIKYYSEMGRQIIVLYQPSEISAKDLEVIRDQLASEWAIETVKGSPDLSQIVQEVSHV